MHRINNLNIGIAFRNLLHGGEDILHGLTIVFSAMAGHGDDALTGAVDFIQLRGMESGALDGVLHGINDRVAGDKNVFGDAFLLQITGVVFRRGEVQVGNAANQLTVHFLGIGGVLIKGPQTCLHVTHGDFCVKARQCGGECRGGISVNQNQVRFGFRQNGAQTVQYPGGDVGQSLPLMHNIQVIVRLQTKALHNAVQHFPVLCGEADMTFNFRTFLQFQHQRSHFDGLRTGAEYGKHIDFFHSSESSFG